MKFNFFFSFIHGVIFLLFFQYSDLKAGVIPVTKQSNPTNETRFEKNFFKKLTKKIQIKLQVTEKQVFKKTQRFLAENGFGKFIAILLFFIPGTIGHITSFVMLLTTLGKSATDAYFTGCLVSIITAFWCLLGSLIAGKSWRKTTATFFIALPAMIILIIACIQLFSIIFGASAANFVYGLLSLALAGTVMLFAVILGF